MLIPPYMTKLLLDQVYPNQDDSLLHVIVIATAALAIFSGLIYEVKDYFVSILNMRLGLGTNFEFYRHLSKMDIAFFSERQIGEIASRARDALTSVGGIIHIANSFITSSLTVLIFPPLLLWIDWKLALLSMMILPVDFAISLGVSRYSASRTRLTAEIDAEVSAKRIEFLGGMSTIQALSVEQDKLTEIEALTMNSARIRMTVVFWQKAAAFLAHSLGALTIMAYTWYGWTSILAGELSLGTYMAFTMYCGYLTGPIKGLLGIIPQLQVLLVHVDRFLEIYDLKPRIYSPTSPLSTARCPAEIVFDSVSFAYDRGPPVLEKIDLRVAAGATIAIVGPSGAGKSSLVQLVPRFYDPTEGSIQIDGTDLRRMDVHRLRGQIGYVQQSAFVFSGSVRENITLGHRNPDQDSVEEAARQACLHDDIQEMEEAYETNVGEGGSRLSEGQKQRIVLARLFLHKSPVIILDEATSAIDLETESHLLGVLRTLGQHSNHDHP